MDSTHIISCLNKHIFDKRKALNLNTTGHLVLHNKIEEDASFPVYKIFQFSVYFVNNTRPTLVFSLKQTIKAPKDKEDYIKEELNLKFLQQVFNWIGTEDYFKVINGTYGE